MNRSKPNTVWIALRGSAFDPELVRFGQQMTALLQSKKSKQNDYVLATLDDLLGAIHALILALHNTPPFKFRPPGRKVDTRPLIKRSRGIAASRRIRTTGKWMAGFHFNSAMFRLSSVYHRSLKIVTSKLKSRDDIGKLIGPAKTMLKGWTGSSWNNENVARVHTEVTKLKYDARGIYWGRDANEKRAISAVDELLTLLEAWNSHA